MAESEELQELGSGSEEELSDAEVSRSLGPEDCRGT